MASNRIGFKQLIKQSNGTIAILLDANIIIPYFDEIHNQHDIVTHFINQLSEKCETIFFTTITIKSEFLEYQRRRFLTKGLLDLTDGLEKERHLTSSVRAAINSKKGTLLNRRQRLLTENIEEGDLELDLKKRYFQDSEIKHIKKAFRVRTIQEELGWLGVCETYLCDKLSKQEIVIDEFCKYLTPNDESQKLRYFDGKPISWTHATDLCEKTGMGYADAMIFNIFKASNIPFLATLDFDLIYGVSINAKEKTVVLPDFRLKNFKQPLKGTTQNH